MPEGSPKTMESEEILSSLARSQTMFAETLARGTVPVDKEIEMRADLAKFCIQVGTAFSNQQAIDDAIQHVDTILRRIPDDSPDRPKFLHELSKAKFELYLQTDSQHSLNLAVFYGRQARELAVSSSLREHDLDTYLEILTNLGYVLVSRFRLRGVLAAAAEADIILSDDEIEAETTRVKSERAIGDIEFLENLFGRPSEYKTELGLRKLAIDPETNHIPFDFGNLARHVLEYEDGPVSPAEFIAREERMETASLEKGRLEGRGWIMQERLLSRRCIYFSPEAVYFQCGKSTLAEGGVNEEYKTYFLSAPMKDDHLLRKANHDNPISDLSQMHELETGPKLWKAFKTYMELVCNYSKRQFTFKPDVLNGFAGIFAVLDEEHFQGSIKSTTLHGIPSGIFIHALLWSPAARIPRRGTRFPTQNDFTTGNPDRKFPSWSWAGTSAPLIRIFHLGSLEVFPDKYEEAGSLLEKFEKERDGMQAATPVDKAAEERPPGGLEQSAPAGNTEPSILIPSTSQGDPGIDEKGDEGKKEPKGKGKEKATEDAPRTGTLWRDPDSKKLWLWFTPPGYEEARKRDPPAPENVLRMTGPVVPLIAFKIAAHKEYLTLLGHVHTQGSQSVRRIFDSDNKHCGLYWEQGGYEWVGNGIKPESEKRLFMLGVSPYGVCYRPREGPSRVEGPIKLFDEEAFPDKGPGSGLVNVLVIDEDVGYPDSTGDRCTIAIIHRAAWEAAGPVEREVRIA
ncbi:hypothetical protein CGCF413_v010411 [Colletotrichum fructicola]|nr:hypothetical protein CGCF413_v010411 [Colletotrichum fructicola]